jgi:hypothetical protein
MQASNVMNINQRLREERRGERTKLKQPDDNEDSQKDTLNHKYIPTLRFREVSAQSIETHLDCLFRILAEDGIEGKDARTDAESKVHSQNGRVYGNKVPVLHD